MLNTTKYAALALCLTSMAASARHDPYEEVRLKLATDDIVRLIDAENRKSDFCRQYEGQQVAVTKFEELASRLPKHSPKSEFETTAQYEARIVDASRNAPTGPFVLALPTDQDGIHYDADSGVMRVAAGAFGEGYFSKDTRANLMALDPVSEGRTAVPHSENKRLLQTYNAQTLLGVRFQVSKYDLRTNALSVDALTLFPFVDIAGPSTVMGFEVPVAKAAATKATIKVALVVESEQPYLIDKTSQDQWTPTLDRPNQYIYHSTILFVKARCGLVLDEQSRVLASMDTGDGK